ncbi:MAG: hypothetical protein LBD75_06040, partial [Candidatus Peribacteria bacterium]|nr:hypothetical protein [Candidatus Peribacteria bacterium]
MIAYVNQRMNEIEEQNNELSQAVQKIIEEGVPTDSLKESHLVGEKIVPGVNVGFLQGRPEEESCLEDHNIGDVASNTKKAAFVFLDNLPANRDGVF